MKTHLVSFASLLATGALVLTWSGASVPAQSFDSTAIPLPMSGGGRAQGGPITAESEPPNARAQTTGYTPAAPVNATLTTASGLVINATFDLSITNNPNGAAMQATINEAIAAYQSIFSDNVTVNIYFRFASTAPNGTALGNGLVARSNYVIYSQAWNTFINAVKADAKGANDTAATAGLPTSALSANIIVSSANGRALGLNTPAAMFANSSVSTGGPYDGIVTLNSSKPLQFTRPTSAGNFDALRAVQHEIDEILGLGSSLDNAGSNLRPQDLFSWSSAGTRNITTSGSRYFSIDSGATNIINFNQDSNGDSGDWLSNSCPNPAPSVQDAFECTAQTADVTETSAEGVNLDVIGYDLASAQPTPTPTPTATPTPTPTPSATPTPTPSATPTPTPTPTPILPTVSLTVAPTSVAKTGTATFTVSVSSVNPSQPIVVNYSMSGNAVLNGDYTLSETPAQVTILPNQSSGSVMLTSITAKTKGREKAIMTLGPGTGYSLPTVGKKNKVKPPKATVTINNR